jgi:parallel beta-helix repeat protein
MNKLQKLKLYCAPATNFCFLAILMLLSIISCKKEISPINDEETLVSANESTAALRRLPHIEVHPGKSIQAAINAAAPGTTIIIEPGTYKESLLINKPGIQLIGENEHQKKVIILNPGTEENGIRVTTDGDGFVLKNVTVEGFKDNGVLLTGVDNFVLDHVDAVNNAEYGLFPVHCNKGVIRFCSATGSSDTGIYVGQSSNIIVQNNVAFANVSGFEIENCTNVSASLNESFDNAGGFLVFLLPGLDVKTSTGITVFKNYIHDNNHVNFAPPGGGFETFIPRGAGMLLVGTDNTTIRNNTIQNNNFVGIATVSTLVLGALAGLPPAAFADIEPNPDGVRITHNTVINNGAMPPPGLPLPGGDLLWDGSGTNNCWKNNNFNTSFPASFPTCN